MSEELLIPILRESVGLGLSLVILVGIWRLLNKVIDLTDKHLGVIEGHMERTNELLEKYISPR